MISPIEKISVNGIASKFDNEYIYSCNIEYGFSENPTKIVINTAPETFDKKYPEPTIALDEAYTVTVDGIVPFTRMSLISYQKNYDAGRAVSTYTLIDPTYILDKIYIGLLNKDAGPFHPGVGLANAAVDFKVLCEKCLGSNPGTFEMLTITKNVNLRKAFNAQLIRRTQGSGGASKVLGGYIILGQEEFVVAPCDLADVTYSLADLNNAIISIINPSIIGMETFPARNNNYRQSYTGTLREVLSAWCADFACTFYYDFQQNKIRIVDLTQPITSAEIGKIKLELQKQEQVDTPPFIINYTKEKNLEGTYDQNVISSFRKPAKAKNSSSTTYNSVNFKCIKIKDILPETLADEFDRNENQIYQSIGISKYFRNLRWAYHYLINNLGPCGTLYVSPSTVSPLAFSRLVVKEILINFFGEDIFQTIKKYWKEEYIEYYVVQYDSNYESSVISWENDLANSFVGRQFYKSIMSQDNQSKDDRIPLDWKFCNSYFAASLKVETDPSTEVIEDKIYPHSKFLKTDFRERLPERARVFDRSNATWDVNEDALQKFLDQNDLTHFLPEYLPFDDKIYDIFIYGSQILFRQENQQFADLLTNFFTTLKNEGRKLFIMAAPNMTKLKEYLKFGDLVETANSKESVFGSGSTGGGENDDCKTICELNVIESICTPCEYGNSIRPSAGLSNNKAKALPIQIGLLDGNTFNVNLIYPSEEDFRGYAIVNRETKFTTSKINEVYGNPAQILSPNTMSLNIINLDISNDMDPSVNTEGATVIDAPYLENGNYLLQTPEQYHYLISQNMSYSFNIPNEVIKVRLAGAQFGSISQFLLVEKGLSNLSIESNENGVFFDIEFRTRPVRLPQQQTLFRNSFIRSNTLNSIRFNTYR